MLENSDAKAVIVEDDEQLEKIREVRDRCAEARARDPDDRRVRRRDLAARAERARLPPGRATEWEERWRSVAAGRHLHVHLHVGHDRPAKGLRDLPRQLPLDARHGRRRSSVLGRRGSITYLFLPLAHSFALLIQLGSFGTRRVLAYWERDPLKIIPNLGEVKPTYFPSVPRIFEKIYTAATAAAEKAGGMKKPSSTGRRRGPPGCAKPSAQGGKPGFFLRRQYEVADKQVLSKIRNLFGGRVKVAVSGAAPINPEILRFFDAAGVLVVEGWGMTETSTAATIATPRGLQVRHGRQAVSGVRDQDRRRRRDPRARARTSSRATTRIPRRRPRPSSTAGCTPATSARSTPRATSRSPAARRTSSSRPAARTSPRPTSRPRSSSTRWSRSAS